MGTIKFIDTSGSKRTGIAKLCPVCKKEFITRADKPSETCGKICKGKLKSIKNTCVFHCDWCKKEFTRAKSKKKNSKKRFYFCSRKCKESAQKISKNGIKEIMPNHYGTSIGREAVKRYKKCIKNIQCEECGEKREYLLSVHHKDGNHLNNIKTNFELVCGNCHIKRHLKNVDGKWVYDTKSLTPRSLLNEL